MIWLTVSEHGEILPAGKSLTVGFPQVADRSRGVVLSSPPTSRKRPAGASSDGSHDPERRDGLLNHGGR